LVAASGTEVWIVCLTSLLTKLNQFLTVEGVESIFTVHGQLEND
jgi:hypothetical protein